MDELIRAALTGKELRPHVSALASQRCIFGVTLDETLADVAAFAQVAPPGLLTGAGQFALARAAATAWYRASVDPQAVQPCRDPMTGLATETHLVVRAAEIYQQAAATHTDPRADYELIVLAWEPDDQSPAHIAVRIRLARLFQRCFAAGQTVAQIGDGAIVVLTARDQAGPEVLATVNHGLAAAMAGSSHTQVTRWPIPRTVDDLTDLLVSLHGSAGQEAESRWRDVAG